ncbi:unnamed protein product [Closterium sp. NIES-65]|nr:unnamed protein product [Closterium sp. NIES-65]
MASAVSPYPPNPSGIATSAGGCLDRSASSAIGDGSASGEVCNAAAAFAKLAFFTNPSTLAQIPSVSGQEAAGAARGLQGRHAGCRGSSPGDAALARARGARALEELAGAVEAAVEAVEGVGVAVGVVAGVGASVAAVEAEAAAAVAVGAEVAEVAAVEEVAAEEVELVCPSFFFFFARAESEAAPLAGPALSPSAWPRSCVLAAAAAAGVLADSTALGADSSFGGPSCRLATSATTAAIAVAPSGEGDSATLRARDLTDPVGHVSLCPRHHPKFRSSACLH